MYDNWISIIKSKIGQIMEKFFKKKKLQIKMSPYEINPIDFKKKLFQLVSKEDFLASAVTMPYKKDSKFCKDKR